jgi:hypothetical protein
MPWRRSQAHETSGLFRLIPDPNGKAVPSQSPGLAGFAAYPGDCAPNHSQPQGGLPRCRPQNHAATTPPPRPTQPTSGLGNPSGLSRGSGSFVAATPGCAREPRCGRKAKAVRGNRVAVERPKLPEATHFGLVHRVPDLPGKAVPSQSPGLAGFAAYPGTPRRIIPNPKAGCLDAAHEITPPPPIRPARRNPLRGWEIHRGFPGVASPSSPQPRAVRGNRVAVERPKLCEGTALR